MPDEMNEPVCGHEATSTVDGELIEHHCGLAPDHPAHIPHWCMLCTATWFEEATC